MKKEAISKINKMGKIGHIIAKIATIFMVFGIVVVVAAMIAFAIMPKDLVTFKMSGSADVSVNLASIGQSITEEEVLKELGIKDVGADASGKLKLNQVEYGVDEVEIIEDTINLKTSAESVSFQLGDFQFLMIAALISILMVAVVVYFVQRLCKAFRYCESPFEEKVIKSMQHLAIAIIPWTLVSSILDTYMSSFLTNGGSISFEINVGNIVVCLVIFALTYVFKYGAVLQQESDETL